MNAAFVPLLRSAIWRILSPRLRSSVQVLEGLHNFRNEVESQFLDPDLESLFADLRAKVSEMLKALSHADAVGEKMLRILPEDKSHPYQSIQKRSRLARRAEAAAVAVYESYSTLVRDCRRKLHVDSSPVDPFSHWLPRLAFVLWCSFRSRNCNRSR
jgi:hypothetical protein